MIEPAIVTTFIFLLMMIFFFERRFYYQNKIDYQQDARIETKTGSEENPIKNLLQRDTETQWLLS